MQDSRREHGQPCHRSAPRHEAILPASLVVRTPLVPACLFALVDVAAFTSEYIPAWHHRELLFQEGVHYIFEVSAELDHKVLIFSSVINDADNFAPKMITKMSCTRNPLGKVVVRGDAKFPPGETVAHFYQIARLLSGCPRYRESAKS